MGGYLQVAMAGGPDHNMPIGRVVDALGVGVQ